MGHWQCKPRQLASVLALTETVAAAAGGARAGGAHPGRDWQAHWQWQPASEPVPALGAAGQAAAAGSVRNDSLNISPRARRVVYPLPVSGPPGPWPRAPAPPPTRAY